MDTKLRVLVVDDQLDTADSLAACVKQWGHEVDVAYNGKQALEIAEKANPHIVLLDIMMPDMDGYVVAKKLRNIGCIEAVIIGITALQDDSYRHKSWDNGFHFYLVKPVDPEKLRKLLDGFEQTIKVENKAKESGIAYLTNKLGKKKETV